VNKPSIVSVIGSRLELRKAGKEYLGRCPFHEDKTPSFSVSEEKGIFHCFGCGAKGDVIDFTMQLEGIGFREAKARLGVADEYKPKPISTKQREAAELAAAWMAEQRRKSMSCWAKFLRRSSLPTRSATVSWLNHFSASSLFSATFMKTWACHAMRWTYYPSGP
jgi:DNA primase catalytic core